MKKSWTATVTCAVLAGSLMGSGHLTNPYHQAPEYLGARESAVCVFEPARSTGPLNRPDGLPMNDFLAGPALHAGGEVGFDPGRVACMAVQAMNRSTSAIMRLYRKGD